MGIHRSMLLYIININVSFKIYLRTKSRVEIPYSYARLALQYVLA